MKEQERAQATKIGRRSVLLGGGLAFPLLASAVASPAQAAPAVPQNTYDASTGGASAVTRYSAPTLAQATTNRVNLNNLIVAASAAGGGVIYLPGGDGDYYMAGDAIKLLSNVCLRGDGAGSTRIRLFDGNIGPLGTPSGNFVYMSQRDNISISGITFNGGVQTATTVSMNVDASSQVTIADCAFMNMRRAISVYNDQQIADRIPQNIRIIGNTFGEGIFGQAIRVADDKAVADPHDVWITDNRINSVTAPDPLLALGAISAIYVSGERIHISGNRVDSTADTGIMFGGGCRDCSAVDNIINSDLVSLFVGSGAQRTRVASNTLSAKFDHGIHAYHPQSTPGVAYTVIQGNEISNCGKCGIHIEGALGVSCVSNVILNPGRNPEGMPNPITNREYTGILVSDSFPQPAVNKSDLINISSNTIIDDNPAAPTMRYGIRMADAGMTGAVVTGNTISNAATTKIMYPSALPAASAVAPGTQWWDATGNRPIWSNGTAWVDSAGTAI
jgi:hypothetical protein